MLEMLFNRWRGTGKIFWKINGNIIYATYWALLVGFVSGIWYWGLLFGGLYILGESFAWGKWIGYIVMPEPERSEYKPKEDGDYINDDGISFPWIHYISNFFIKQRKDYLNYLKMKMDYLEWFEIFYHGYWNACNASNIKNQSVANYVLWWHLHETLHN